VRSTWRYGRPRHDLVDETPVDRALALDALRDRAEQVGEVAPHLALVGEAREPAGAGQHPEERHLGQRHRRRAVVGEDDLVARERELVAAAGARAGERRQPLQPGPRRRVLDREARLVGVLAEVHLERVRRRREHVDVRARGEHAVAIAVDDHDLDLGVLEAQARDRVVKLDVHAEVVAIELQAVAGAERRVLLHRHREAGRLAGERELPMPVPAGVALEVHRWIVRSRPAGASTKMLAHFGRDVL